jgi:acid phosphatase
MMENTSYGSIVGSSAAPYINSLLSSGAVATNYYGVAHPSLPNYLASTGGSTFGITSDCTTCWVSARNIADNVEAAGKSWKAYEESMPSACYIGDSYPYAQKHDPFIYFNDIRTNPARCQSHVVPYTQLASDLRSAATTPAFSFITPNMCNDMHDCSVATGDSWLRQQVPQILNSPAFTNQHSVLMLTWDEDDYSGTNQVATVMVGSPLMINPAFSSSARYNHYSLLTTIENTLGLSTLTANDAGATVMTDMFDPPVTGPLPFKGLYTLDGWGGVHPAASSAVSTSAFWPGWKIARAAKAQPGASAPQAGFVLDGWGGLHSYGSGLNETMGASGHYWPRWDIARDFAFLPDGTGGFVLDGWGGLHAFRVNGSTAALSARTTAYWPGWDIARKVVIFPDGSGGYVLDGWGGLHPFGINGAAPVGQPSQSGYWPGWNIARDVALVPGGNGRSGYVLDGWGGLHRFQGMGDPMPAAISTSGYWPGWDIARGVWFLPGSATAGYTLEGWGGVHPFGGAPAIPLSAYWPGWDIAVALFGA